MGSWVEHLIINASTTLAILGYLVFAAIIFAESGLFFGFFLPGDSLIFALGLLISQGRLPLDPWLLWGIGCLAAISGDSVGYAFGHRVGRKLFRRPRGLLFNPENLAKAEAFYEEHGAKTIVLARFTPIIRTFAPIVAGAAGMPYSRFLAYNIVGGIAWISAMLALGYFLGQIIPGADRFGLYITAAIIILSLVPSFMHVARTRRAKR